MIGGGFLLPSSTLEPPGPKDTPKVCDVPKDFPRPPLLPLCEPIAQLHEAESDEEDDGGESESTLVRHVLSLDSKMRCWRWEAKDNNFNTLVNPDSILKVSSCIPEKKWGGVLGFECPRVGS